MSEARTVGLVLRTLEPDCGKEATVSNGSVGEENVQGG